MSEFALYGPAGARIDRIAAKANTSKERLYAHFAGKEALFDAVTEKVVADVAANTALRGDDLPGYVGRLIDGLVANPEHARLSSWLVLVPESDAPSSAKIESRVMLEKVVEIRRAQTSGHVDPDWDPLELLLVITGLARSAAVLSPLYWGLLRGDGKTGRAPLRRAAVEATRRIVARSATDDGGVRPRQMPKRKREGKQ